MSERTAHEALAHFLHHIAAPKLPTLAYVWHTANESAGGLRSACGVPLDVLKEARSGIVAGVWDWLYLGQNKNWIGKYPADYFDGIAIELKSTKAYRTAWNGLTPEQRAWQAYYEENNWHTVICPEQDWPEVAKLLVWWVGGNVQDFYFDDRGVGQ